MKKNSKKILLLLTIISNIVYILWRIFFTIPKGEGKLSLICAIMLLIVEVMGMVEMFVHYHGMSNIQYPKKPQIDEDLYPHVDVFIATYNESVDLVKKTVNGCVNMEYPDMEKVHIYICDDGNREEMKRMANNMGVNYITREERKGAKAGNLNNAMAHSTSPLIATFDADMIPRHNFLMETVPYFLKNEQAKKHGIDEEYERIGFIQSPQSFYNPDLFQFNLYAENRIPNEQDYFYRDIQVARNKTNSVIYGGSNTVISREALNEVGGFFTNSITEDFATGILIQSNGYKCYAIPTVLASGLSPTDLKSLVKQRERWARGCIQTARRVNIFFRKGLSLGQKITYMTSVSYWYSSIKRFIFIMSPIMFSVFNVIVVDCTLLEVLVFWLPMYIFSNISLKQLSQSIRNIRWSNVYETILLQSLMPAVILETLCISKNKFSVTKKDKVENDFKYRLYQLIPYIIYIGLSIIGIVNMIIAIFKTNSMACLVPLFWLIGNTFNLVMSVLFICGRKQFRNTERFNASVLCDITLNDYYISTETIDISEEGFAFILDTPEYISPDEEFHVEFNEKIGNKRYNAKLKAKIVNVIEIESRWKYSANITKLKEEEWYQWMNIVHDRVPTLPESIDSNYGMFEDLQINLKRRIKNNKNLSRKTPRVNLDYCVEIDNNTWVNVENFNYNYILVTNKNMMKQPKTMNISITDDIILNCSICNNKLESRGALYKVENIDEIMRLEKNRHPIIEWMMHNKKDMDNETVEDVEIVEEFEFDPMEYV